MKIFWKRSILAVGIVLAAALLVIAAGLFRAATRLEPVAVTLSELPRELQLGDTLTVTLQMNCPWGVKPASVVCRPGAGMVEYGTPEVRRTGWGWAVADYNVVIRLRPYQPGAGAPGEAVVHFDRIWGAPPVPVRLELPAVAVSAAEPLPPGSELPVAGKLAPVAVAKTALLWWLGGLLVVAAVVIWWLARRRDRQPVRVLLPWEVAELEVQALRDRVQRNQDLKGCLVRLTDVVREYLEQRFALRSTRQTTAEFLRDLHRPGSPLNSGQQERLERFMTAADLVKFAGREADSMLLNPALDQAEELIEETRPRENVEAEEVRHV